MYFWLFASNRLKVIFYWGVQVRCAKVYPMLVFQLDDVNRRSKRLASVILQRWCKPRTTRIRLKSRLTEVSASRYVVLFAFIAMRPIPHFHQTVYIFLVFGCFFVSFSLIIFSNHSLFVVGISDFKQIQLFSTFFFYMFQLYVFIGVLRKTILIIIVCIPKEKPEHFQYSNSFFFLSFYFNFAYSSLHPLSLSICKYANVDYTRTKQKSSGFSLLQWKRNFTKAQNQSKTNKQSCVWISHLSIH